jgi:hypothetical protein
MARNLVVRIQGDASSLTRAFATSSKEARNFERDVSKIGRGALGGSGIFRGLGRSIAFASTAFLGGFGLVTAIRASLESMSELEQVGAQTAQVLKTTGGVAGVTASHVEELGVQLSNVTGVSESNVRATENLLLSYTNLRNVAGKNNDIFDEATKLALDLSARYGGDLRSAALIVGKALQNPVRGMTQLNRITGGLSDANRKLVRRLVDSGKVLQAQRIIVRDLRRAVGGASEVPTLARSLNIVRNNIVDLGGKIAEQFRPQLTKALNDLKAWVTNLDNQRRVIDDSKQIVGALGSALKTLRQAFRDLNAVTGSTKHTLELLFVAFAAFKAVKLLSTLGAIATQFGLIGAAATTSAAEVAVLKTELAFPTTLQTAGTTTAGNVALIGNSAKTSAVETTALRGSLLDLSAVGPISLAVVLALGIIETPQYKAFRKFINDITPGGDTGRQITTLLTGNIGEVIKVAKRDIPDTAHALGQQLKDQLDTGPFFKGADALFHRLKRQVEDLRKQTADAFDVAADVPGRKGTPEFRAQSPNVPPPGLTKKELAEAAARQRQAREALRQRVQDEAQLRIDQASLTKGTADDIAALKAYNKLLQRRIAGEHDVIDNTKESISVQKQIADLQQQIVQNRIDRLQFGVDVAAATGGLRDDLRALGRLRGFLEQRLAIDKGNLNLQRQIFEVNQQIADVQKRRRDERQFARLGLGPTGEEPTPNVRGLKKELASVADALEGSFLDTKKTRGLLGHIREVLSGGLGSVSNEVRSKVKEILDDLRKQLKQSSVDVTRFHDTARGQFTGAGARPGGRLAPGVTINGGIHLHGVQDVKALENALAKRAKQRAHARRGNR